jgi:hypothetical protein
MFRFKQPTSGSLLFVLCYSYNSQLKYVAKDGSTVWLQSHSAHCMIYTQNKDWIEYAATQPNHP